MEESHPYTVQQRSTLHKDLTTTGVDLVQGQGPLSIVQSPEVSYVDGQRFRNLVWCRKLSIHRSGTLTSELGATDSRRKSRDGPQGSPCTSEVSFDLLL